MTKQPVIDKDPDDEPSTLENTINLADQPAFQQKQTEEDEIRQTNTPEAAIAWVDKRYAKITDDGVFKILNLRLPGKIQEMTRKNFIEFIRSSQTYHN